MYLVKMGNTSFRNLFLISCSRSTGKEIIRELPKNSKNIKIISYIKKIHEMPTLNFITSKKPCVI